MTTRSEIESLLFLLDDPDEFVRNSVLDRFASMGESAVPLLDEIRAGTRDELKRKTLESFILKFTFPTLEQEFLNYLECGVTSHEQLETGILMLTRLDNPTIRESVYSRKLDVLANQIETDIRYSLAPFQQMDMLIRHIFERHGFQSATENYFDAQHAQMNSVLDLKKGIPLNLALVVLFVARRLDLPFFGVNMPVHFLLRYEADEQVVYLDPFNKGRVIPMQEMLDFLKRQSIRPEQAYFAAAHPAQMLIRAMRNLLNSYSRSGDEARSNYVRILITHFELMAS